MKCINENCCSSNIEIIKSNDSTILDKAVNGIGAAICAIGCLTPLNNAAGKATQSCWDAAQKSAKITYRCKECGCTWSATTWY